MQYLSKHNDVDVIDVAGFQSTPYSLLGEPLKLIDCQKKPCPKLGCLHASRRAV
jgi:hypothetical protein